MIETAKKTDPTKLISNESDKIIEQPLDDNSSCSFSSEAEPLPWVENYYLSSFRAYMLLKADFSPELRTKDFFSIKTASSIWSAIFDVC